LSVIYISKKMVVNILLSIVLINIFCRNFILIKIIVVNSVISVNLIVIIHKFLDLFFLTIRDIPFI